MKGKTHFLARKNGSYWLSICGHMFGTAARTTTDEDRVECTGCKSRVRDLHPSHVAPVPVASPDVTYPHPYPGGGQVRVHAMVLQDQLPPRAEWATWRQAVRAYMLMVDAGHALKSSADPSRFEALPGASDGIPEGDLAQRNVAKLYLVGKLLERAFTGPFVVQTLPRLELDAQQCAGILEWAVVGRPKRNYHPMSRTGEERKKVNITMRQPEDAEEIAAQVSKHVGFAVTKRHVGIVTRIGGRAIEPELFAKGLIAVRDEALGRSEREEDDLGKVIRTWEKIANHVNLSESTVQRAVRWSPPLPVRYVGKLVEADADELDAWRKAGPRPAWTPEED